MKPIKRVVLYVLLAAMLIGPMVVLTLPTTQFDTGPAMCLSKILFQQECYGCGMTRACMRLAHGQLEEAARFNKLAFIVFPLLCVIYGAELVNLSARLGLPVPNGLVRLLRRFKL